MGHLMGMRVRVVDDRSEWANHERFPPPTEIGIVDYEPVTEQLGPIPFPMTPNTYVIIATWGYDLPAMAQALSQQPAYIGLVGSPTKARVLFERLRQAGFTDEAIRSIRAPSGLAVGAESPGEIAISILAEVLTVMHGTTGQPLRQLRGARLDALFANPAGDVPVADGGPDIRPGQGSQT
jgi:xanthine dehydrogenase accessory factor